MAPTPRGVAAQGMVDGTSRDLFRGDPVVRGDVFLPASARFWSRGGS